ncbi:unnamed protein product [Closterium sp. NIES-53]
MGIRAVCTAAIVPAQRVFLPNTNPHHLSQHHSPSPCLPLLILPPPPPIIQTPQTTGSTPKSTAAAANSPADTVALQQQRLESLFKENAQLREQLTEAQRLAEEWEFAKARVEDEWEDRLNQAQAATGRALGEREQLFAELEQAKEKIASESSAKKKLEESRALFESELRQEIRSKVALLEAEVSRLSVEVKAATNRAEMSEKGLVEAQVRVADMEAREREHAEASAAVAEQHASLLFNMETEIEGAEQRESEARADAEQLAAEVSKLKGEMEEMFRAKTDAVSELMLMKGDVERLEKSKQVAEAAALEARTKLVAANKIEQKLKRRLDVAKVELDRLGGDWRVVYPLEEEQEELAAAAAEAAEIAAAAAEKASKMKAKSIAAGGSGGGGSGAGAGGGGGAGGGSSLFGWMSSRHLGKS